jgi:glycerophosphoryl diester phosphodiesterase
MANKKSVAKGIAITASACALAGGVLYSKLHTPVLTAKPLVEFEKATDAEKYKDRHLTAHRGLSAIAPENTLPAYEAAGKTGGYAAIECDAYCTTDNVWVIMHDNDVKKMTDRKGKVTDFSYEELRNMRFDNGANYKDFDDLHVCTIKEYIDVCKKYGCRPQIEIKDGRVEKLKPFYELLKEEGILDSVIVISFNFNALKYLRSLDSDLEIWYIVSFITNKVIERAKEQNFGVNFRAQTYARNQKDIQKIHDAGLTSSCWTVDTPELLNTMLEAGVEYITTNCIYRKPLNYEKAE